MHCLTSNVFFRDADPSQVLLQSDEEGLLPSLPESPIDKHEKENDSRPESPLIKYEKESESPLGEEENQPE